MGTVHKGGCLCGAVTFEAQGEPLWAAHCHCHSCRRATASVVATYAGFEEDKVRFTGDARKSFASSPGVTRSFCGTCGTPLSYAADRFPGEIHLFIATFDDPEAIVPTAHVYTTEQISWLHMDDGLPRYEHGGSDGG